MKRQIVTLRMLAYGFVGPSCPRKSRGTWRRMSGVQSLALEIWTDFRTTLRLRPAAVRLDRLSYQRERRHRRRCSSESPWKISRASAPRENKYCQRITLKTLTNSKNRKSIFGSFSVCDCVSARTNDRQCELLKLFAGDRCLFKTPINHHGITLWSVLERSFQ